MEKINTQAQNFEYLKKAVPIKKQEWPISTIPLVSISCTTYNQKDYIVQCIEGFLAQETTFPVEIIIHDDASTDGTSEIVKEYSLLYPHLFKAILQEENQYRLGKMINTFNFEIARGEYIALCHGDDYWIDTLKLEKQVTAMQEYNVDISGHPAKLIDIKDNYLGNSTGFKVSKTTHFTAKKLINNNGNMLPFGSIVITQRTKDYLMKYSTTLRLHTSFQLIGALNNGLLVLPDAMSVYRINVPGSTTELMLGDLNKKVETTIKRIHSIKTLKKLYGSKYYFVFNKFLARQMFIELNRKEFKYIPIILKEIMKDEDLASRSLIYSFIIKSKLEFNAKKQLNKLRYGLKTLISQY